MATNSGGSRHRQRSPQRRAGAQLPPGRQTGLSARPTVRIGAAVAIAGSGVLASVPAGALGELATQRELALVDNWNLDGSGVAAALRDAGTALPAAPMTFDESLYYLLNDTLGIGNQTVPQLFRGAGTVGDVLGVSGLSVEDTLGGSTPDGGLMHLLGLDAIHVDDLLPMFGLNSTENFDAVLNTMGLGNVTLDFLLTPLGIPSTQTTLGLAHRFSVAHLSIGDMLNRAGFSPNDSFNQLFNRLGLGGTALPGLMGFGSLVGQMTCPANISADMTVDQFLQCLLLDGVGKNNKDPKDYAESVQDAKGHNTPAAIHVNKNTTIEQLLTSQHFYDSNSAHTSRVIGNWTLGEILSQKAGSPSIPAGDTPFLWNTSTTVKDLIDHIHVNTGVTSAGQDVGPSLIMPWGSGSGSGSPVNEQSPGDDSGSVAVPPGSTSQHLPTLGATSFGDILRWINLDPNLSLADIITGKFWVGSGLLGGSTIGDVLQGMIVNPQALGPIGTEVGADTTIQELLDGMGWGNQNLNEMLGLAP